MKIKDVGEVMAESIKNWFSSEQNKKLIEKFKEAGIKIQKQEITQGSKKLEGRTFVFTGSFETMSREKAEELVRDNGGDASSSVSAKTDYVVAGTEPGSKYEKAQKLGVKIITEKEFLELVS
jgi:DNA ligase (NAD+)